MRKTIKSIVTKKLMILTLAATSFWFLSCEDTPEINTEDIVVDDDYYEFQDFILTDYEIPALISLPDETANIGASTKPEVKHDESDIKWDINVGRNFQLLIEDYGDITDLIEVEKKELAEQKFFKVKYLIDEEDMILYERVLLPKGSNKASPTVGIEHKTYHVYAKKVVNNITYELQSGEDGYEKVIVELMAKSIKSFRPNTES
ncbi:MAG: hypothetical protein MK066_07585 [Crocinitomicaceae bacterium]|nr:hypothetical protein [Crocinitomicaceae bacterium]